MRIVLNKKENRQLQMLEYINELGSIKTSDLLEMLKVDIKTLKQDILDIAQVITPIDIFVTTENKCKLIIPDSYNFDYVYSCFLKASVEFQLIEAIFLGDLKSYAEISEKLFISTSSLQRMITRLNNVLATYGLKLETNPMGLNGEEEVVINFICHYLAEKYQVTSNFLNEFENKLINEVILSLPSYLVDKEAFAEIEKAKWLIITTILRLRNGYLEPKKEENLLIFAELMSRIQVIPFFTERFERVFHIDFSEEVLFELVGIFLQPNYVYTYSDLEKLQGEQKEVANRVEQLVSEIEESYHLMNPDREELIPVLYNLTSMYYFGRAYILNNREKQFGKIVEVKWPTLYAHVKAYFFENTKYFNEKQFYSFLFYLITTWNDLFKELFKQLEKLNVDLFLSTTVSHMKFLKAELEISLDNYCLFHICKSLEEVNRSDSELVITNLNFLNCSKEVITISHFPIQADIEKIADYYNTWIYRHK